MAVPEREGLPPIVFSAKDAPLRRDVRVLGQMLGKVLKEQGSPEVFRRTARRAALPSIPPASRPSSSAVRARPASSSGLPVSANAPAARSRQGVGRGR